MKPIIIIGAARSGTKMLRGIFASHPDVAVFPSEIDYIWRWGNEEHPNDQLTASHARPEVANMIRNKFSLFSRRHEGARIVEKSVANSLRVDFVNVVFPDAYFVHLIRDGRATSESVKRSWESGVSLNYYFQKFRGVNWLDAFYLAPEYVKYHLKRKGLFGSEKSVKGPHFSGIRKLLETEEFLDVCGIQWSKCVKSSRDSLNRISEERVVEVRYENLVENPIETMESVFAKVDMSFAPECIEHIRSHVNTHDIDKWRENLTQSELASLLPHIVAELEDLGYTV